uniref:Uncharacterized protein n=1 Tax=Lygus hesperus TaxID=30085 RepID=A0A0A9VZ24_LYGHE
MSSSRKTSFVYHERKVRDEHEIQSLLLEDDDDDGNDEEEPSNDLWMVEKSSKSPCGAAVRLSRSDRNASPSKTKENGEVSPLKIKRKLSYAVNKVETPNKRPDIKGRKSVVKKEIAKGSKTPQSKKTTKRFSSDDSDFESVTPSKPRKSHRKTKKVEDDDDDDYAIKTKVSTPSSKADRHSVHRKAKVKPPDEDEEENFIQTPSKKRLSDGKKNDGEDTSDYTPSKRRKQQLIPRPDPDEVPSEVESTLPLSSQKTVNHGAPPNEGLLPLSSLIRKNL